MKLEKMTDSAYVQTLIEMLRDGMFDNGEAVQFESGGYTLHMDRKALSSLENIAAYLKKYPHVVWSIEEDVGLTIPDDGDRMHYIFSTVGKSCAR